VGSGRSRWRRRSVGVNDASWRWLAHLSPPYSIQPFPV
jgi:hypothetical protein